MKGTDTDTDLLLMQRIARGESVAMEELVQRFVPRLSLLIDRLTAWGADRDDILQETLLAAWNRAASYRGDGPLEGWLRKLAINQTHRRHRARRAFTALLGRFALLKSQELAASNNSLAFSTNEDNHQEVLQKALVKLSPNDRTMLVLFYFESIPGGEIAKLLSISPEALHVRLHRARQRLRQLIEKEVQDDTQA